MTDSIINDAEFRKIMPYQIMEDEKWFGRKCRPRDVDGEIEIDGHLLYIEWKADGKPISGPELRCMATRLYWLGHRGTEFILWHSGTDPYRIFYKDVTGIQILRRDQWLEGQPNVVQMGAIIPLNPENAQIAVQWWCAEWGKRAIEAPNKFVTTFRKYGPFEELDPTVRWVF
jgi:hypothetical protein